MVSVIVLAAKNFPQTVIDTWAGENWVQAANQVHLTWIEWLKDWAYDDRAKLRGYRTCHLIFVSSPGLQRSREPRR